MTMVAAFDIGIKNFAFAVKDDDTFISLKNINLTNECSKSDLNKLKKKDLTNMMEELQISNDLKIKKKEMVDLIFDTNKKKSKNNGKNNDVGLLLFDTLNNYKNLWTNCSIFLIERQMVINLQALKLSHYLEAYFKLNYPEKKILNYNSSFKTKKLGAINLKTKNDRKEWTIQYVKTILKDENLRYFESLNKQDDVADVVCMIESFMIKK